MSSCFCEFRTDTGTTFRAIEASMTLTRGVTPSVCTMQVAEYDASGIAAKQDGGTWIQGANGTLTFGDGVNGTVSFFDCRVMDMAIEKETTGYRSTLRIADRRWRWAGKPFTYLEWNTRDMQGTVVDVAGERATAEEMGTYLLQYEMNEGSFQVMLPGGTDSPAAKPFFKWEKATPAACLQELCDFYDASVTLTPNTNMIRIFADGSYNDDPASASLYSRQETKYQGDPIPEFYIVYGAMRRMEVDLPLTPVVLDVDGSLKTYGFHDSNGSRITTNSGTRDCSWMPKNLPWEGETNSIAARYSGTTAEAKTLRSAVSSCVDKSLYRWFQLPGTFTVYSEGSDGTDVIYAPSLWRKVCLETNALEQVDADTIRYAKSQLYGTGCFKKEAYDSGVANLSLTGLFKGQFSFDPSSGVIRTSEPIGNVRGASSSSGTSEPGTLWLRAVIQDQPSAYAGTSDLLNGTDTSIEYGYTVTEVHEDFVYEYGSAGTNNGTALNRDDRYALAQSYVDVMASRFLRKLIYNTAITTTYPGIHAFACDGLYQQVTWTLGWNKNPVTVVSRDTDHANSRSSDLERQAVWQGRLYRERQNRAAKLVNEQFQTSRDHSDND